MGRVTRDDTPASPETQAAVIRLRVLGSLELGNGSGGPLDRVLAQHKRVALLAYLVLSPGLHRRDVLVALLWPDLDHERSRRALRQAVYFLRRELGADVFVTRGQEEIGADRSRVDCDAVRLERAFEAGDLQEALDLYRGELLAGFHVENVAAEFEHWLDDERFRVRRRAGTAALALADAHEQAGDLKEAAALVRQVLTLEPTSEEAVGRLMSLMERLGDRGGAVREYEAFHQRLEEEWGIAPSEETCSLARDLRRNGRAGVPRPSKPLVGRQREAEAVVQLLMERSARLVTLTGAGGSGKTRLAIEVAGRLQNHYPKGVFFVPLASSADPPGVLRSVARTLGLTASHDQPLAEQLRDHLRDFVGLIVLDNFEHLMDAAGWVEEMVAWTPAGFLITSRMPLRISGEREFRVPLLTLPDPDHLIGTDPSLDSEAVALFVERAIAADPSFRLTQENVRAVIDVCRRLDGLPLALELAAARMNVLPVTEIAGRLDRPFSLLTRGPALAPVRHRTLEAAIRWSVDLLDPHDRDLFLGLSVFRGGCSLDAVEALLPGSGPGAVDTLSRLLEASLVQREDDEQGHPRYVLLETVRQFAWLELTRTGDADAWKRRHARHFAEWAAAGARAYCSPGEEGWLKRLDEDYENLCAALEWAIGSGHGDTAGKLATALWWYWWVRGYAAEGRRWIERVLCDAEPVPNACRARCLVGAGALASAQGDFEAAITAARESLALARQSADRAAEAGSLQNLGFAHRENGNPVAAEAAFIEALELARQFGDDCRAAVALFGLGSLARERRDYETAIPLLRESQAISEAIGNRGRLAHTLLELGRIAGERQELDAADRLLEEARGIFHSLGQKANVGESLERLAEIGLARRDHEKARNHNARALEIYSEVGYRPGFVRLLLFFAEAAWRQGHAERSAQLAAAVENEARGRLRPEEDARRRELLASLSRTLDAATLESCLDAGRRPSREQLLALATDRAQPLELRLASR